MSADLRDLRNKPFMMRRSDRVGLRLPIYDSMIVLGACMMAYTIWGVHARASVAEHAAIVAANKSTVEAAKTAKLEADARVSPVKGQLKKLEVKQGVLAADVKSAQVDKQRIFAEHAELIRRFRHVQAELDTCREANLQKQKEIDSIRKRQYDRYMELRTEHYQNNVRIERLEKSLGLRPM